MTEYCEGTLVLSNNSGRYAIDDAVYGRDLTTGDAVIVMAGDAWVEGFVEHSSAYDTEGVYAAEMVNYSMTIVVGYFVRLESGGVLGLCSGMRVRVYV